MNCWYCDHPNDLSEDNFGDHLCVNCGITISIYDPAKLKPVSEPKNTYEEYMEDKQQKEEEMDLKNWSKDNAKFIKIKDGESYEGIYKGCKQGVNMNGEPAVIYNLDGKEFKSSSTILADKFSAITEGSNVKISRSGEGLQTKWKVETL